MTHSFAMQVHKANKVAMTCFRAADSCNPGVMNLARREEAEFERRYGVTWREIATVDYKDYLKAKENGHIKSA
jgi:hypothetical protein